MKIRILIVAMALAVSSAGFAQKFQWVDSVFNSLTPDERIAQLVVMRASSQDGNGNPIMYTDAILRDVQRYNIGAICLFQGTPQQHAELLNAMNPIARTPVMVTIDAEWGLGMRMRGIENFPFQITLGALPDAELVYRIGAAMGEQCRRMNIHVNYAPTIDINNNPANPVIGARSFGEDMYTVARYGTRIMQGMQDKGIMACAKHFPGHGDVSVDSHYDLPLIRKSLLEIEALELYPFKELFANGVASVMVAHLAIPAIDSTPNLPTSLSHNAVTGLMRNKMGYEGLIFTDALEMQGVAKFFKGGAAAVESLIAGNDMLCLPGSVQVVIDAVNKAIAEGRLSREEVDEKCRRVLASKYDYVLGKTGPVELANLNADLNKNVSGLRTEVARQALTVVKGDPEQKHLFGRERIAYVAVSRKGENTLGGLMQKAGARVYHLAHNASAGDAEALINSLNSSNYQKVIFGLHDVARGPNNFYGVGKPVIDFLQKAGEIKPASSLMIFGNPYMLAHVDTAAFDQQVICYEDDPIFQAEAFNWLKGLYSAAGKLPVTAGSHKYGTGLTANNMAVVSGLFETGMNAENLKKIDAIAEEAIRERATPGMVVSVMRHGHLAFQKAYGYLDYEQTKPVNPKIIYDLASVTKTSATTVSLMKLYEEGKLDLQAPISRYLPWLNGSDKAPLTVENLLLHQAGMVSFIPFYRAAVNAGGVPYRNIFSPTKSEDFPVDVTDQLYMRESWIDTMYQTIRKSPVKTDAATYVYSDNDFILLGDIVASISGQSLPEFAKKNFYNPLGMTTTDFRIFEHYPNSSIAPTENEKIFRRGLIWGYVHDPGAAMFDNVAGHAGLFSNSPDLLKLYQMLLNGGTYEGKRYLKKETIDLFTSYQTPISRRGLGFDKPEKDNLLRDASKAYPAQYVSPKTFGHTGFTGISVWVDPVYDLIYMFMSNRVHPDGSNKLLTMNIRSRIHDVIYESIAF